MALQFKKNDNQQALQSIETEEIKEYNIGNMKDKDNEKQIKQKVMSLKNTP